MNPPPAQLVNVCPCYSNFGAGGPNRRVYAPATAISVLGAEKQKCVDTPDIEPSGSPEVRGSSGPTPSPIGGHTPNIVPSGSPESDFGAGCQNSVENESTQIPLILCPVVALRAIFVQLIPLYGGNSIYSDAAHTMPTERPPDRLSNEPTPGQNAVRWAVKRDVHQKISPPAAQWDIPFAGTSHFPLKCWDIPLRVGYPAISPPSWGSLKCRLLFGKIFNFFAHNFAWTTTHDTKRFRGECTTASFHIVAMDQHPQAPEAAPQNTIHLMPAYVPSCRRRTRPQPVDRPVQYQLEHGVHPLIHPARPPPRNDDAALLRALRESRQRADEREKLLKKRSAEKQLENSATKK
ncbi:hypothetical protein C8F04DRAFT_1197450 [Mycena alexandri]|uniref:Uncharacterized protein n=1 Tax=Mycena alexandri TaxID=1745969 RepID=A0AAD6S2I9_9AGAR|nr:hypothetical protein C8F04DRAFT_1197450 [Mycena alexandri]